MFVCAWSERKYTVDLLDRYRKALETAVQISSRYNVPPLPGRTFILLDSRVSDFEKKSEFCLPPDPEENNEEEEEKVESNQRRRKTVENDDDKLAASVRAGVLPLSNNTIEADSNPC